MAAFFQSLARGIDRVNGAIGWVVAWAALALVLVQFAVVILRYVFGIGSILLQESLVYLFGTLFMLGAGFTLWRNGHVRVDIFYRDAPLQRKAWVDALGVVLFLWPLCATLWIMGEPYVSASWAVREGSRETSGIPAVYILKTEILVFTALMALQGLSLLIHAVGVIAGGRRP